MIRTINTIAITLMLIAAVLWVVLLNNNPIPIYLTKSSIKTVPTGFALIISFVLGLLGMGIITLVFGLRSWFRDQRHARKERNTKVFYDGFLTARGYSASKEWDRAKDAWGKIIKKDPTNILARVELAKVLENAGERNEALKVLDAARTIEPTNTEVLLQAANLHEANNNKTVAIDNLALTLYHNPNKYAALKARDLSEEIGRINDAMEYQSELLKLGAKGKEAKDASLRLEFRKILNEFKNQEPESLKKELDSLLRKNKSFLPIIIKLAELEKELGNFDKAAQHYAKAAKETSKQSYWNEAVTLWTENNMADKATAAARTRTRETTGKARLCAEIDLIRLHLEVNNLSEAKELIDGFSQLAKNEEISIGPKLAQNLLILKGLCLSRQNEYKDSSEVWQKLSVYDYDLDDLENEFDSSEVLAPSPTLSTP